MKKVHFFCASFFSFLILLHAAVPDMSNCVEREKALTLLETAESFLSKAEDSYPSCNHDSNSTDPSGCAGKKSLAYIQISKKIISDVRGNLPECKDPEVPVTKVPDTKEPFTKDQNTKDPNTKIPYTKEPDTMVPYTKDPYTNDPNTKVPYTKVPETKEPCTKDPNTKVPDTTVPYTKDPYTKDPNTKVPYTKVPDTMEPYTKDPYTKEPNTKIPYTKVPDTKEPYTKDPYTKDPNTNVPYTKVPVTKEPYTKNPYTKDPNAKVPYTKVPNTMEPHTKDPYTKNPDTKVPYTKVPDTKDPYTNDPYTKDPNTKVPYTKVPDTKDPYTKDPYTKDPDTTVIVQQDKHRDCHEILESGRRESRVYTIWPSESNSTGKPLQAYCDMETDNGGWTVIQRRGNFGVQQDFNQDWETYKNGFGNITKDFWFGNENIRVLCHSGCEIRFDLKDKHGIKGFAVYKNFKLSKIIYLISISGYTGTVGDSMQIHNNMAFSTKDNDNEGRGKVYRGGWWYTRNMYCNLNGLYKVERNGYDGIVWYNWRKTENLAGVEIKVRPKKN